MNLELFLNPCYHSYWVLKKLRFRGIKYPDQGPAATKWQNQDSHPDVYDSKVWMPCYLPCHLTISSFHRSQSNGFITSDPPKTIIHNSNYCLVFYLAQCFFLNIILVNSHNSLLKQFMNHTLVMRKMGLGEMMYQISNGRAYMKSKAISVKGVLFTITLSAGFYGATKMLLVSFISKASIEVIFCKIFAEPF